MMLSIQVKGMKKDIIAAVQKSGFGWALDRNNGSLLWSSWRRGRTVSSDSRDELPLLRWFSIAAKEQCPQVLAIARAQQLFRQ
ncbi:hypothetical protein Dsin_007483 [Dipteronia sinensis]|uniref:Uncharacterized protein n=1 Tax=Dipteronia sinensis TaxID=43782 RepID=A0AAE0B082_9ROSI|nr:hypothetical protein Dsin_007483 [Dipteronia sinensis]